MKMVIVAGLAPMAGFTHRAFRRVVSEIGGAQLFFTEMLNSRIVSTQNPEKDHYCKDARIDRPLVAQIVGGDPEVIAAAIKRLEPLGFDAFDINMGCPQRAIMRHGWGAALLNDKKRAFLIVEKAKKVTKRPIFVKLRSFPGHRIEPLIEFSKGLEARGVDLITIHPRAVEDGFKRKAKWEELKWIKKEINIPIFGNGDIFSVEDAEEIFRKTGVNGILIGRGAIVRPWLFWEIVHKRPWPGSPLEVLEKVVHYILHYSPKEVHRRQLLLFLSWFLRNWEHHLYLFSKVKGWHDPFKILTFIREEIDKKGLRLVKRPIYSKL
ncbi:tRNA dihydrouridine synthase B [Dissulfuribacter thermophilus]|uniref:tRNA-dihydrouridine synthase n=1 Tax=Dissulfuribacter thermophilus TaxID=1156395 RepID=A0A1B9F5V0_9BACT|nr:tRNA-dihydrouridine synthase family protein [Dissulfuribacter thermophilus]OCC15292.1 tRNA dihydrouridine synthase B [Dissulfuribacter thermophilus]